MANITTEKRQSDMTDTTAEKRYNVAVVGATGVVGQHFLRILASRNSEFPVPGGRNALTQLNLIGSP